MKKSICLFLILMTVITGVLTGCSAKSTPQEEPAGAAEPEEEPAAESTYVPFSDAGIMYSASEEVKFAETKQEKLTKAKNVDLSDIPEEQQTHSLYSSYIVRVNCTANVVNVYIKDEYGAYTVPYTVMLCSTGEDTPQTGRYKPYAKYPWGYLFGDVFGQYTTTIVGNILFHSVPYTVFEDPTSLEYEEYDKLGTAASAGCVRLTVIDAKWIYDNAKYIKYVEFYTSEDPGPLGKPELLPISEYEEYRGWDPTDPDPDNPWHTAGIEGY